MNHSGERSIESDRGQVLVGRVRGIAIRAHWSLAILGLAIAGTMGALYLPAVAPNPGGLVHWSAAIFAALAFVGSILLHELGHAVVAQRTGLKVHGIVLRGFGGFLHLTRAPARAKDEAVIAMAGPVAGLIVGAGWWLAAAGFASIGATAPIVAAFEWLGLVTLGLSLFNLLPASPLDGGRVLRALCWQLTGRHNAGHIAAAQIGRALGAGLGLVGVWRLTGGAEDGLVLAVGGWIMLSGANGEANGSDIEIALGDTMAGDVVSSLGVSVNPQQSPRSVLDASDPLRLPPGHLVWADHVDAGNGEIAGLLLHRRLLRACNDGTPTVGLAMVPRAELLLVDVDDAVIDIMRQMECFGKQRAVVLSDNEPVGFFGAPELHREVRRKLHRCRDSDVVNPARMRRPERAATRIAAAVAAVAVMIFSLGVRDVDTDVVCDCQLTHSEAVESAHPLPE